MRVCRWTSFGSLKNSGRNQLWYFGSSFPGVDQQIGPMYCSIAANGKYMEWSQQGSTELLLTALRSSGAHPIMRHPIYSSLEWILTLGIVRQTAIAILCAEALASLWQNELWLRPSFWTLKILTARTMRVSQNFQQMTISRRTHPFWCSFSRCSMCQDMLWSFIFQAHICIWTVTSYRLIVGT
jgi:hypothetical protein